jgi:hypothetical protein
VKRPDRAAVPLVGKLLDAGAVGRYQSELPGDEERVGEDE